MNSSNYRFTLDTQSNASQVSISVRQGDTNRKLYINLTDSGSPYIIEDGCYAVFSARKADGKVLFNECIIEKNTTIRYDFTEQTTAYPGVVDCEIRLYGIDGELITSPRFIMVVYERVVNETPDYSDSEWSALDNIVLHENERIVAETERVTAEYSRAAAEVQREKRFDTFLDVSEMEIHNALNDAQTVNGLAQSALKTANEASERANEAASNVVSPTVSVTSITGGHRVAVTDKNGTKTFDVMNGEDGEDGEVVGGTRAVSGSYTGTGFTTKTLTFDFTPKIVFVQSVEGPSGFFIYGCANAFTVLSDGTSPVKSTKAAWTENTLSMSYYGTSAAQAELFNTSGKNYLYTAIG